MKVEAYPFSIYVCIFMFSEFVAAVVSVFVGYRVVAAFGAVFVLGGFLGASFVDPSAEIELMGFLVGFLGGMNLTLRLAIYD